MVIDLSEKINHDDEREELRETNSLSEELTNDVSISLSGSQSNSTNFSHDRTINDDQRKYNEIRIITANARSLLSKVESLVDNFDELSLHAALITETWFKEGKKLSSDLETIALRDRIKFITRSRDGRGGGVGIAYDPTKMSLSKHPIKGNKHEVVCAHGVVLPSKRKIVLICMYIPPKQKSETTRDMLENIADTLSDLKIKLGNPLIVVAGDTNKRDVSDAYADIPNLTEVPSLPTRGNSRLDVIATNFNDQVNSEVLPPLESEEGTASDHRVLYIRAKIQLYHDFKKQYIFRRRMKPEDIENFNRMITLTDWSSVCTGDPSSSAEKLTEMLDCAIDTCFPEKRILVKTTDKPWMNERIRRAIRKRKRKFRVDKRRKKWKKLKAYTAALIKERKKEYLENIKKSVREAGNTRAYYQAIKRLDKKEDGTTRWSIEEMFPNKSQEEIAEMGAEYFNKISQEFEPLGPAPPPPFPPRLLTVHEVSQGLKKIKKPKSQVRGDIPSNLISPLADVLAIPLTSLFNEIIATNSWPAIWKSETVHLIPKKTLPSNLSELRNLSCTPLFSKLLETYVLTDLRKETRLTENQFGGIKGLSTNHFLIDMWQDILEALDDNRAAVNVLSIDFEKAFNRLDHRACLEALRRKGASEHTIGLVHAFLYSRTMRVKVGRTLSAPRTVPGGSPQGSILANYLFCCTTDDLDSPNDDTPDLELNGISLEHDDTGALRPLPPIGTPIRPPALKASTSTPTTRGQFGPFRPPGNLHTDLDEPYESSEDEGPVATYRIRRPIGLESSGSEDDIADIQAIRDDFVGPPERWTPSELSVRKYIDDFSAVEKVCLTTGATHFSTRKTDNCIFAKQCNSLFKSMSTRSKDKGMKINPRKTQTLCITSSINSNVETVMNAGGEEIRSGEEMKILGFYFGKSPDVSLHIRKLIAKFRSCLWSMYHLKESGMSQNDLIFIYKTALLPVLDYAVPTYHSMLNQGQKLALEGLQRRAFKIAYGSNADYKEKLNDCDMCTLDNRREEMVNKFAQKASRLHFKNKFPPADDNGHDVRNKKLFKEFFARTERLRMSPIFYMRRLLNNK